MSTGPRHERTGNHLRVVYLILAHRYPGQVVRLVEALDCKGASFLIHLDRRTESAIYRKLRYGRGNRANVQFVARVRCYWAGFGIVRATLQGITAAVEKEGPFDFLVLLSGQDYPVKSNSYIRSFLYERRGTSFISHHPFPFREWKNEDGGWDRVRLWYFRPCGRFVVFPRARSFRFRVIERLWSATITAFPVERNFPRGFHPFGGAQFWCLAAKHVRYIYDFVRSNPRFVRFFHHVSVPDEIFFQTVLGNSPFANELCNKSLTFVEWYRVGATLVPSDYESLRKTPLLFARKFDETEAVALLDRVDRELLCRANPAEIEGVANVVN